MLRRLSILKQISKKPQDPWKELSGQIHSGLSISTPSALTNGLEICQEDTFSASITTLAKKSKLLNILSNKEVGLGKITESGTFNCRDCAEGMRDLRASKGFFSLSLST